MEPISEPKPQSEKGLITPQNFDSAGQMVSCLGIAAGSFFAFIGLTMLGYNYMKYSGWERAEGTSIRYERGREGMGGTGPHIEFTAADGKLYVISGQGDTGNGGRGIRLGEKVAVLYNPEDPYEGILDLFFDKWFTSAMFVGVGFGVAVMAIAMARVGRRDPNE